MADQPRRVELVACPPVRTSARRFDTREHDPTSEGSNEWIQRVFVESHRRSTPGATSSAVRAKER